MPPLIPTLVSHPPAGDGWLHEIKHDGYRTILAITAGRCTAFTRNGHNWSDRYRRVCDKAARLTCRSAVLDGEMVVQGENGISDFHALRLDISNGGLRLFLFAFVPFASGRQGSAICSADRASRTIARPDPRRRVQPDPVLGGCDGSGAELFAAADGMGLEGIVSKRATSRYRSGRSTDWLKAKCFTMSEFVVIGVGQEPNGPPVALLANLDAGALCYAGAAFIGLASAEHETFWKRVEQLRAERPVQPQLRRRKVAWVRPELRVLVKHLKGSGGLRHASVQGLQLV